MVFYSDAYKVHHISATIRPTVLKFFMQLPYGIIYAYISWIFEFCIFRWFSVFSLKNTFYIPMFIRYLHHILATIRPRVAEFAIRLPYSIPYRPVFFGFLNFTFFVDFSVSLKTLRFLQSNAHYVHHISATMECFHLWYL